jgi:hypothetical protein
VPLDTTKFKLLMDDRLLEQEQRGRAAGMREIWVEKRPPAIV